MRFHRIYAIILRYLFLFKHSYDRITDVFYWPTIDLLVWGMTSSYIQAHSPPGGKFLEIVLSGLLFWLIVWRGQYEITVNLLEDLWNKNLVNIFVSPLKFWEWVSSFIVLGIIKAFLSLVFASLVSFLLYKFNIFTFGFYLLPFGFLLLMSGWWVGFFVAGLILRYGTKIQTIAWSMVALLSPFSAIYYPVSILPDWAQKVAYFIPISHIFEGIREVLLTGKISVDKLLISTTLNIVYLGLSLWFARRSFNAVLRKGLVKVY